MALILNFILRGLMEKTYTMFIGGLQRGTQQQDRDSKLANLSQDTIAIIFDSIDSYSYSHTNEKTSYAVESRSAVTDHVYSPDSKFSFTGRITSSPYFIRSQNEWDKNTDPTNPKGSNRFQAAYDVLKAARDAKQAITLSTEETVLTNYVIVALNILRDSPLEQLVVSIDLEEMRQVVVGKTVLANVGDSLKIEAGGPKNKGATAAKPAGADSQVNTALKNPNPLSQKMFEYVLLPPKK